MFCVFFVVTRLSFAVFYCDCLQGKAKAEPKAPATSAPKACGAKTFHGFYPFLSVKPSWLFSEAHTSIRASRQAAAKKAAAKKEDGNGNVATVATWGFSTCSCGFCGYLCFHVEFFPGHSEFSLPGSR